LRRGEHHIITSFATGSGTLFRQKKHTMEKIKKITNFLNPSQTSVITAYQPLLRRSIPDATEVLSLLSTSIDSTSSDRFYITEVFVVITIKRVEVVKFFVCVECYKFSIGRLMLRNDTPTSTNL
jgi:hypothetical protein